MNKQGYGSLFAGYNADAARGRLVVPRGHGSAHKQTQTAPVAQANGDSVAIKPVQAKQATPVVGSAQVGQVKIQPRWRPSFKAPVASQEAVINHAPVVNQLPKQTEAGFMKTTPVYGYEELPLPKTVAKHVAKVAKAQPATVKATTTLGHRTVKRAVQHNEPTELEQRREEAVRLAAAQKRAEANKAKAAREAKIELARQQAEYQARRMAHAKAEADNKAELARRAHEQATKQARAKANQLTEAMMRMNSASSEPTVAGQPPIPMQKKALSTKFPKASKTPAQGKQTVKPVAAPVISFDPLPATLPGEATTPASAMVAETNSASGATGANDNGITTADAGVAVATMTDPASNLLARLSNIKITFTFKINKQRVLAILRYLAIAVIIAASAYLACDTYATNQTVKSSFSSPANAMSIAGTNPATADQTAVSQEAKAAYTTPADQPRYISIPAIGVNARVMSVGVNSKGNIDTPSNLNDTAWYDGSAKPGQEGQVFIDGHTSFSNSINAAFNDLPKLREGNQVVVETGNGTKFTYKITTVKTVDASKVDMGEALNPPAGSKKGLTLMTCTGTFNYRTQTADKRLVVYAVQI